MSIGRGMLVGRARLTGMCRVCEWVWCAACAFVEMGGWGGGVLAGCVSSIAEVGLLCVRACVVGRGGGLYVCGEYVCVGLFVLMGQCLFEGAWLHGLTFCRVGEWRLRVCA